MTVYEGTRTPPAVGQSIALRGQLCVAGDYVWDLATDPTQEGAPYDGRRAWRVDQLVLEQQPPIRHGVSAEETGRPVGHVVAVAATGLDEQGGPDWSPVYLLDVTPV